MRVRPGLVGAALLLASSWSCLLKHERPAVERINPGITPQHFRVIATVAGGNWRPDLQISAMVRQRMQDSGFVVVPKAGRWPTELEAVQALCGSKAEGHVDGVLFVWYNRLLLSDCATQGWAYEIGGAGATEGITAMTDRLIGYLRRPAAAST